MSKAKEEQLLELLAVHGIKAPVDWNTDKPTREGSQWFVGKRWDWKGQTYMQAWFGDYKSDLKIEWTSWDKEDKEAGQAAKKHSDELRATEAKAREKEQENKAIECATEWPTFASTGLTPYLQRKLIGELYGARVKENPGHSPILIVPLRDVDGRLWNYQRVYSEKLSKGDKFFADGARIEGLFHVLSPSGVGSSETKAFSTIYLCEGFATACSVQMALGAGPHIVVSAFNAGNLQPVATALKARYPTAQISVCADNDAYTKKGDKPFNVGLEKGRRAAGSVGGRIVWPIFKAPAKGFTDFNDLHAAEGIERVRDQILNHGNYVKGIQPLCLQTTRNGKFIPPTEKQLSDYILEFFGERLTRQDKSLFLYNGQFWREVDVMGIARIQQMIGVAANGTLGIRDIEAAFRYLLAHAPQVPAGVNFFQPNPYVANFQNGTLHFWQNGSHKFHREFRKHDPADYLTSVLPFDKPDWEPGEAMPQAPLFDAMVNRLWDSCPDKEQTHLLAQELLGSALAPAFPTIVIFYGASDSGKSTLIKLMVRLVNDENICSVQLCDMHGFNMETMVGKLVNFDTDIDLHRPINDSEVKKIIDRMPRRVRRKGLADVFAHLPALHLFAANGLPKSLDGSSHAFGKRFILVHTTAPLEPGKKTLDFETYILKTEMPGVLARALAGLYRLIENSGQYTVPESSKAAVLEMENQSDVVGQFISDLEHGEIATSKGHRLVLGCGAQIERPDLGVIFSHWQDDAVTDSRARLNKYEFFKALEMRGFGIKTVKGSRLFMGIGVQVQTDSIA